MFRKIRLLLASSLVMASFAAITPTVDASILITCDDSPPYAVWYTDGSGGGSRLVQCWGDQWSSLSSTFNDQISSVVVIGPNNTGKVPCGFSFTSYAGSYVKLLTGQHGFTLFQWPYTTWTSVPNTSADNQISSISWCNV